MKQLAIILWLLIGIASAKAGDLHSGVTRYRLPYHYFQQNEEKEMFWDRVTFGGNVGLQFGAYTNILISPAIGYIIPGKLFDDRLTLGFGITYMYSRIKYQGFNYESNIYGGRTFARFFVFQNFFTYLEHEFLNAPDYTTFDPARTWVNSVFIGGGYMLPITQRGGVMISVLYNLSYTVLHPLYSSPWNIRIGFMF